MVPLARRVSTPPTRSRGSTTSLVSASRTTSKGVRIIIVCAAAPHTPNSSRHRDPERRAHLSRDPLGWPPAGERPCSELAGLFGRPLGGRHISRGQQRIQRQDVGEPQWTLSYGGAARTRTISASGLRPPRGGGDLHRSWRVREPVGLHGEDGAGRRYRN